MSLSDESGAIGNGQDGWSERIHIADRNAGLQNIIKSPMALVGSIGVADRDIARTSDGYSYGDLDAR